MSKQRQSKPYQFKPPPYLSGDTSLHLNFSLYVRATKRNLSGTKRLHINLSQIEHADVLGIASIAANLAKSLAMRAEFEYQILFPEDAVAAQMFRELKFESLLHSLGLQPTAPDSLWTSNTTQPATVVPWSSNNFKKNQLILFIPSNKDAGREEILKFARSTLQNFYDANVSETINYGQIHQILHEIIKNSIDHSMGRAVLAVRFERGVSNDKLSFLHCELGVGIVKNVRSYLGENPLDEQRSLAQKGDISALLHWAFNPGNSSRPESSVNAGLGLSTIKAAARGGDIRVLLFDAESGVHINRLPNSFSHKSIRKALYSVHAPPCFMYIGHTTISE